MTVEHDKTHKILQFFGPQHPGYTGNTNGQWVYPDTANTSSIIYLPCSMGLKIPIWARWTLIWTPPAGGDGAAQLVSFVDGSGPDIWNCAYMHAINYAGPTPQRMDVTEALQAIIGETSVSRYIGLQLNTNSPYTLYSSYLEIVE